jgi:hypothetical protein
VQRRVVDVVQSSHTTQCGSCSLHSFFAFIALRHAYGYKYPTAGTTAGWPAGW